VVEAVVLVKLLLVTVVPCSGQNVTTLFEINAVTEPICAVPAPIVTVPPPIVTTPMRFVDVTQVAVTSKLPIP